MRKPVNASLAIYLPPLSLLTEIISVQWTLVASEVSNDFEDEDRGVQSPDQQTIPIIPVIPNGFRECRIDFLKCWKDSEKSDSLLIIVEMLLVEYQFEVLQEYEKKKAAGDLSHRMLHPSPARLREECEVVYNKGCDRKDNKTLEGFFGHGGDKQDWSKAISRCETGKFKPLISFITGKNQNTRSQNC